MRGEDRDRESERVREWVAHKIFHTAEETHAQCDS